MPQKHLLRWQPKHRQAVPLHELWRVGRGALARGTRWGDRAARICHRIGGGPRQARAKRHDVVWVVSEHPAIAVGCFTRNMVKASPVTWSMRALARRGSVRAVLLNAGNANACNGPAGDLATRQCARAAAKQLGCVPLEVLVASTGVIGVPLPYERIVGVMPKLRRRRGPAADLAAAKAIMTTDLAPKTFAVQVRVGKITYTVGGMAKGSGMIHPNMATMLGVLTCDAPLPRIWMQRTLRRAVQRSFNMISVDHDTSTNDCVLLMANGTQGGPLPAVALPRLAAAIEVVCEQLAEAIAQDGEGATKLLVMLVRGAKSEAQAAQVARTIVASPLVKTALTGCDPNWGRVLAAAGRAGVAFSQKALSLSIGGHVVVHQGVGLVENEKAAARHMRQKRVLMELCIGGGKGTARALGCDLTAAYVAINADYRT